MAKTARKPAEPKGSRGASPMTTTHPTHAVQGGISLLILPLGGFIVLPAVASLILWAIANANGMRAFGLALGLVLLLLAGVLYDQASARHRWEQRRAAISIGWLGIVFGWGVGIGPSKWWGGSELVGGLALGLWWFFVKTEPVRGNGSDVRPAEDGWARAVNLADSTRPVKVDDDGTERKVTVEHTENTREDLVKSRTRIESKGKLPEGSIRIEPVIERGKVLAHKTRLVLSRSDRLNEPGEWTAPDRPGALISDPLHLGVCIDGKPHEWLMTPTEKTTGSPSALSVGESGAAKTAFQKNLLGNAVARQGVVVWASDTRKFGQWVPFVRPFIDWMATTVDEAKLQLKALERIVPERTRLITDLTGEDRWTPICWTKHRIPFLLIWHAESATLQAILEEELTRLNEVIRSAGCKVVEELQRASETNISTDYRNLIPESFCFRVQKQVDATMGLNEDTLDAGAEPWGFDSDMPGLHYAEMVGEPRRRWGVKRRTLRPNHTRLAATVAEWMTTHPEYHVLDETTQRAAQAGSGGGYGRREIVTVSTWLGSDWGKPPQLRDPAVMEWINRAKQQPVEPARPAPAVQASQDEETPDLALAELEEDDDVTSTHEDDEVAAAADAIEAEIDAEVDRELGPDPEETPVGSVDEALAAAEAASDVDDDPDIDWSTPATTERPSPQQRAKNFQVLVNALFTSPTQQDLDDPDDDEPIRAEIREQIDGRWVVTDTDTLVRLWMRFPGEDVRPSMYPRLYAHVKAGNAKQLARGEWAISARAVAGLLVVPDDYDPAVDADEAADDATLRDLDEVPA